MTTLHDVEEAIHVRYEGRTYVYQIEDLDIADNPNDSQVIEAANHALADELGEDVSLEGFTVDSYPENGLWDIHPQAKFG